MGYCTCPTCGNGFKPTKATNDSTGWHTICPKCGGNFDIEKGDFAVTNGGLVRVRNEENGTVIYFDNEYAPKVERDLPYSDKSWKLLKRTDFGIDRVCHYSSHRRCYNCSDRAKCNADIFERLARYEDTEMPPETVAEYKKFEDKLVRSDRSFQHILELLEAEKDGRLVILPAKEVYELTWDAGPDCDLICPVSIDGHGCCDMCEKGKVFAYKHTCKQEHIEQLGHNAFLTKEEAEAEAAKINAMYEGEEKCTD